MMVSIGTRDATVNNIISTSKMWLHWDVKSCSTQEYLQNSINVHWTKQLDTCFFSKVLDFLSIQCADQKKTLKLGHFLQNLTVVLLQT